MEIRINIPEELAVRAQTQGVPIEEYVEALLSAQIGEHPPQFGQVRTAEQVRAWLDALAQFSDKIPPMPEEISREWIYQDHD